MKTVILCGGFGRRLSEEGNVRLPKPLVEIGDKPILHHIMEIYERQGFNDFVLCLGYKGDEIKQYFLNLETSSNDFILNLRKHEKMMLTERNTLNGKITFVDTGLNSMTGARVARIRSHIGGDKDFFLTYGDGLSNVDLRKLCDFHKKQKAVVTLTGVKPIYQYGLIETEEGLVTKFDEKPEMRDRINGGFMVCNEKVFDYVSEEESCIFEQEPLRRLTKEGKLASYLHDGFWHCMDTQKHVDELNKMYCSKNGPPW